MISVRLIDETIRVNCSKNQTIDTAVLKQLWRTGLKFITQNGNIPVIVDLERNVKLSEQAQQLFSDLNKKCKEITLVIISG